MISRQTKGIGFPGFTAGAVETLNIPRDGVLLELFLRLQFTITHGAAASTGPLWNGIAGLFKKIELTLNGRDTVVQIDGPGLLERAIREYKQIPYGCGATVDVTNNTATAYDIIIPLTFFLPNSRNPLEAALPVDRFNQNVLEVTWGDVSDIFGTVDAATTITGVTCSVEGDYLLGVDPAKAFKARILDSMLPDLTATNNRFAITIDTGTGLDLRSLLVVTTAAGLAVDTILNGGGLQLKSGSFTFQNRDSEFLQSENMRFTQAAAHRTGVYFINTEKFGLNGMAIKTDRAHMTADLELILDATKVAGTNTVRTYREYLRPFVN